MDFETCQEKKKLRKNRKEAMAWVLDKDFGVEMSS
jgi:hypothetical protein